MQIYDLDEPVEDEKGVVYEKKAILDYVRQRGGSSVCPMTGTASK